MIENCVVGLVQHEHFVPLLVLYEDLTSPLST